MSPSRPGSVGAVIAAVIAAAVGAGVARAVYRRVSTHPPGGVRRWERINHRGSTVTLAAGPALAAGAAVGAALAPGATPPVRLAGAALASAVGSVGLYDDLIGS